MEKELMEHETEIFEVSTGMACMPVSVAARSKA